MDIQRESCQYHGRKIVLWFIIALLMMGIVGCASGEVYYLNSTVLNDENPGYVITEPGIYYFDGDVLDIPYDCDENLPLLHVTCSDVVIDGQNYQLSLIGDPFTYWTDYAGIVAGIDPYDPQTGDPQESPLITNITIKNLQISNCAFPVRFVHVNEGVIENIDFGYCSEGFKITDSDYIEVLGCDASGDMGYFDTLAIEADEFSEHITVQNNNFDHGISLPGIDNTISGNSLTGTSEVISISNGNLISGNNILGGELGISITGDNNVVEGNTFEGVPYGIHLEGSANRIQDNEFIQCEHSLELWECSESLIDRNIFLSGGIIRIEDSEHTIVKDNSFDDFEWLVIEAWSSPQTEIFNNTIGGGGISIGYSDNTLITDNVIVADSYDVAVAITDSSSFLISQNQIQNSINGIIVSSSQGSIRNNVIWENENGISIDYNNEIVISGNRIYDNWISGISVYSAETSLDIYDNYLGNVLNVDLQNPGSSTWNTDPATGPNIVGGPSIGGNYWGCCSESYGDPVEPGFSDTAEDTDGDGFADEVYEIDSDNIDYYPLVHYSSPPEYGVYYLNSTVLNSETTRYVIDQPGTYIFDEDIIDLEFPCDTSGDFDFAFPLIWVQSSDVIIEGNGHVLDAFDQFDGSYNIGIGAIAIGDYNGDPESARYDNVTVRNLHITDWSEGIAAYQNVGGTFEYNVIENCGLGIEIYFVNNLPSDLIVRMNTITSDGLDGPYGYEGIRVEIWDIDDTLENPAIIIEKNQISQMGGGISVQCSGIDVQVISNTVTDCWDSGIGSDSKIISDNIITRCGDGIGIGGEEQEITNNTVSQCQIGLNTQGYGHIIRDNIIEENSQYGILFDGEEYQIINNYLNNTENINFAGLEWWFPLCIWNTPEPVAEQNIVGGPSIGGNYWGTPDGTGYSQTATDQDGDGFADDPFVVVSGYWDMDYDGTPEYYEGIDYFPLVEVGQTPGNQPPAASFTFEPTSPSTADNVFFTDASSDSDGTIAEYSWDFDGLGSSELQNPLFWFDSQGSYTVTLTVTDADGASNSTSQVVEVTGPAPGEVTLDIPGGVIEGDQLILDTTIAGTSVTYVGNIVTIQNNGLTITLTMAEPVQPPVDGIITGTVSSIQVESKPVTDGDYEAYFIADMAALPTDATITSSLVQGPGSLETVFEAAAVDAGMEILDIASTFTITRTNIADDDSTGIIGAVISMKVPESWVIQVGGPESVHIIRIPEEGEPEILDTTYTSGGGYYTFSACSENGLSVFGLVAMQPPDEISPFIGNILATPNPAAINTVITLTATVDDTGTGNSNIATVQYSTNGATWMVMAPVDGAFDEPVEEVTVTLPQYAVADILSITIRANDAAGNVAVSEPTLLAIYDPTGAFITAGGWFTSPAGAYKADPTVTGKANLGLNSKYKSGSMIPTGETEFHLKEANLKFKATNYDWMVINGAKAIYHGSGTINGAGNYGFLVSAISGDISRGEDLIRFRIWDKATNTVIFDNGAGSDSANPTTPLGGGNVKIHT